MTKEMTFAERLSKAQCEFKEITRSKQAYNYKYAPLEVIIGATKDALAKYGIAVSQNIEYEGDKVFVVSRLISACGDGVEGKIPLSISTHKPQDLGSAITYFRRYLLGAQLNVSPDDDDDGQRAQDNHNAPSAIQPAKKTPKKASNNIAPKKPATQSKKSKPIVSAEQAKALKDKIFANALDKAVVKDVLEKDYKVSLLSELSPSQYVEFNNLIDTEIAAKEQDFLNS